MRCANTWNTITDKFSAKSIASFPERLSPISAFSNTPKDTRRWTRSCKSSKTSSSNITHRQKVLLATCFAMCFSASTTAKPTSVRTAKWKMHSSFPRCSSSKSALPTKPTCPTRQRALRTRARNHCLHRQRAYQQGDCGASLLVDQHDPHAPQKHLPQIGYPLRERTHNLRHRKRHCQD